MSHLKTKFDTIYTPNGEFAETWHKLQTCVNEPIALDGSNTPDAFVKIVESKFTLADVDSKRLITTALNDDDETSTTENPLDSWKMILADHRDGLLPIHVPKAGYQVHQNADLFKSFVSAANQVIGDGKFEIATIDTLGGCSQFFVSMAIKGKDSFTIGKKDKHRQFFNLVSSHNGIVASAIMLSVIRVVCMNTVMASLSESEQAGRQTKFKHTANSLELITPQAFAKSLEAWVKESETFQSQLKAFAAVPMTLDQFRAFTAGVFTNKGSDELSTNSWNRIKDMEVLFQRGKGNKGETLSDGINAFTEYFTSGRGVGGRDVDSGKRVASANFGRGNDWKRQAILTASNEEAFAVACKRGEMLYADKLTVETGKN